MINKKDIKNILSSSPALKVFVGNVTGSAVYALSIVIIGRIFTKEPLGNFQLFFSVVSIFTPMAALAFEKSIMLGRNRVEISRSFFLSVFVLAVISVVLLAVFGLWGQPVFGLLKATKVERYFPLIVLCILMEGVTVIFGELVVKEGKIFLFSVNRAVTLMLYGLVPILLSFYSTSFLILIAGRLIAYSFSIIYFSAKGHILQLFKWFNIGETLEWFKFHKRFPLFNVPYILVNNFSLELPVFLLYQGFGASDVGLYAMSYRLIQMPLGLIQSSIMDLYYRDASELHNTGREMIPLFKKTLLKLFLIGLLPLPLFPFLKWLVILALGEEWANVALYIEVLYPFFFFSFLHTTVSVTLVVLRKQEIGLLLAALSLMVRFLSMRYFNSSAIAMLAAFSATGSVFYIVFNVVVYAQLRKYERGLLLERGES